MKAPYLLALAVSANVTPDRCRCLVPDGRPILFLTTTRDIADGGGVRVGPLVSD